MKINKVVVIILLLLKIGYFNYVQRLVNFVLKKLSPIVLLKPK